MIRCVVLMNTSDIYVHTRVSCIFCGDPGFCSLWRKIYCQMYYNVPEESPNMCGICKNKLGKAKHTKKQEWTARKQISQRCRDQWNIKRPDTFKYRQSQRKLSGIFCQIYVSAWPCALSSHKAKALDLYRGIMTVHLEDQSS